jgi:antibiotic biosynthesis monooxygenase (ABM) superfamily enzyme
MNSTAPKIASAAVEDGLSTSTAVTELIDRIPRAGMQARLEQSINPRRGRMTVVTWIGIFPAVSVYERVVIWIMPPGTPTLLRIAVITALVVPTMSYLVIPQLTRLFKKWLYPGPS